MFQERVGILVGHFGSGKTEIAINAALRSRRRGPSPVLVDLDVVKPYFRSRSARAVMAAQGVEVVAPEGENIFADLPIIVPRIRALLRDEGRRVIVDAGGDPTGARALGSLADAIAGDGAETLAVLNFRRPFTASAESAVTMVRAIEAAARRRVTGLVSNTHLMGETTAELVMEGYRLALEAGARLGVPVVAVVAEEALASSLDPGLFHCEVFPLVRIVRPPFEVERQRRTRGPLFVVN